MTKSQALSPGHVVITGGSSGIGAAIAALYAERDIAVSLIARTEARLLTARADLLSRFPSARIRTAVADVADAKATSTAIRSCEGDFGPCSILVASAGIVSPARFLEQGTAQFDMQISTNLIGTANAVRTVLPGMVSRKAGHILIIGSGAGLVGVYGYAAYCASKAGLAAFAEALRQECKPQGVVVSICMPPDTDTPQLTAELPMRPAASMAIMGNGPPWSADAIARHAVRGMEAGKAVTYPGLTMKLLGYGNVLAPVLRFLFDRKIGRASS